MTNKPFALIAAEIKEIAALRAVQELWGAQSAEEMEEMLGANYTVKFEFVNGSPGYVGDLFLIQPDYLDPESPAVRLIRDREKRLVLE